MRSRLLVFSLIAAIVTLISGTGLWAAGLTEIWNTGNVTSISHNNFPQIKGNYLVWQGRGGLEIATSGSSDWEIFYIDIDNKVVIQLTDDDYDDISPQTDGDYVVWQKHDTSRSNQVFLYKIGENLPGSMISNDDNKDNYSPRIAAGRIVWTSQRVAHFVEPGEIMLYDAKNLSGPDPISDNTLDCSSPRINSETVIWVQSDGNGAAALFMFDLTSENPAPEAAPEDYVWPDSPQTDGGLTVLTRHDGSDREIVVYNNYSRNYEQITDNDFEDSYPCISGNSVACKSSIAWVQGRGKATEIFLVALLDVDNDGIPHDQDACPCQDSSGFDADSDGCIDTLSGLTGVVETLVTEGVIEQVLQNSLLAKVENAEKSVDKENICAAIDKLEALKNEVNDQRGNKISDDAADLVVKYVDNVITSLLDQLPPGESC